MSHTNRKAHIQPTVKMYTTAIVHQHYMHYCDWYILHNKLKTPAQYETMISWYRRYIAIISIYRPISTHQSLQPCLGASMKREYTFGVCRRLVDW